MKEKTVTTNKNTITRRSVRVFRCCAPPFAALFALSASASTIVWTGSADALWTNTSNWNPSTAVPGTGDTATFNAAAGVGGATINLGASNAVTLNTLLFDTASAAAYTIGTTSQTLTLDSGGAITKNASVTNAEIVNAKIVLGTAGGTYTITNNSTTTGLTFAGASINAFAGATSGTGTSALNFYTATNSGTSITVGGQIVDGAGNIVAVHKQGAGTMSMGSSSSNAGYTGGTYIDEGTLNIVGSAGNLKTGTSLYIAGGTTFGTVNQPGTWFSISQQWNGNFTMNFATAVTLLGGTVDLGASGTDTVRTITVTGSPTINSIVSNGSNGVTKGLTKAGAGTLALTGMNIYTGATSVTAGTLSVGNIKDVGVPSALGQPTTVANGTISIGSGSTAAILTYTGGGDSTDRVIDLASTTGGVTLDQSGTGEVKFTSAITATGGGIKTLTLQGSTTGFGEISGAIVDNSSTNKTSVIKNGTGTWTLSGTNTYTGGTTLTQGELAVSAAANLGDSTSGLTFNSGTLRINGTTLTSYASGSIGGHAVTQTATKLIGLNIYDPANNFTVSTALAQTSGGLTKLGAGTLTLSAANSYTGTTTLSAGKLAIKNTGSGLTQNMGPLTLAGADVSLESNNAGSGTLSTTFTTLTARVAGNTANIVSTVGTVGSDNILKTTGAAGFIDKGIFFNGVNFAARNATDGYWRELNYSTTTGDPNTENVGTITTGKHVKLTTTPGAQNSITLLSLNLSGPVDWTQNASQTLTVPGIIKSGGSTSSISGGTGFALGAETVIRTDLATDILDINGAISGTALTKSGAGTLRLSGSTSNTYTGATTVNGGTLELNKSGSTNAIGAAILTINNGALVKYTGSSTNMINTSNQALNINGTGQLDFNGVSDGVGNIVIDANGANANTTPIKNTAVGGTLSFNSLTIKSADGFTTLIDTGAGTLSRSNNSVTISSTSFGKTQISGNFDPTGGTLNITGGRADYDVLIDALILGSGGLSKTGIGTLRLTGPNTFTGVTQITGKLTINTIQDGGSTTANSLGKPTAGANSIIALNDTGTLQYIGSTAGSSNRVINLNTAPGGTFTLDASGNTAFALSGGITTSGTSGTSALNLTGSGVGSQSGSIVNGTTGNITTVTKNGAGTWTLSNASNTYTGATTVNGGTLLVSGSLSGTKLVNVNNTATLGGTSGTIGTNATTVNVNAGGTLAPSASIGTLNVGTATGNTVNFVGSGASKAVLSIELNAPSSSSDLLFINGNLNLGADDQLTLSLLNGGTATGSYTIATYTGTLTGTFDTIVGMPSGYTINYGDGSNDSITIVAVPEPGAAVSLLGGLGLLLGMRRRRS